MPPIAMDDPVVWRLSASMSVSLSIMCLHPAKMAEQIEVLFGVEIPESKRHTV